MFLEKESQDMRLSYESDGVMGAENKEPENATEEREREFFNTTQNSE